MFSTLPLDVLRLLVSMIDMRTRFVLPLVNKQLHSILNDEYWLEQARVHGCTELRLLFLLACGGVPKMRNRVDGRQLSVPDWLQGDVALFDVSRRGNTLYTVYLNSGGSCYVTWKGWLCYLRSGVVDCRICVGVDEVAVALIHANQLEYCLFDMHCILRRWKCTHIDATTIIALMPVDNVYDVVYIDRFRVQRRLHFNENTFSTSCHHTGIEESEFVCYVEPL
jgi:hypothetical protein